MNLIFLYIIVFLTFFVSIRKKDIFEFGSLSKIETDILKGFFAVCVILHHLGLQIILPKFFSTINGYLDGIAVGVFFFLSSYGLVQSYLKNKENYYKKIF